MVEYLKYKDQKLPIRLSYSVSLHLNEEGGNENDYEKVLYYGLESGYKAIGKEFPFKKEDMFDILEDCFLDFLPLALAFFQSLTEKAKQMSVISQKGKKK